jgi:predicted nucleic acid-binding protein
MRTNSLFVDTSGWMAQLSPNEMYHDQANAELRQAILDLHITIYTTDQVLAELVALMTTRRFPRQQILNDVGTILRGSRITKLYTDQSLFLDAWALLTDRPDKEWSLADAILILRMQQLGVTEVLTNDHQFEQAGFVRLLT